MGWANVDEMLEQMSPEQFEEWVAMQRHSPLPEPWLTDYLLAAIYNRLVRLEAVQGNKKALDELIDPATFLPGASGRKKKKKKQPFKFWEKKFEAWQT